MPVLEEGWRRLPELVLQIFLSSSCGLGETSENLRQPPVLPDREKNQIFLSVFPAAERILKSIWISCDGDCAMHIPSFTQQVALGFSECWECMVDALKEHRAALEHD